MQTPFLAGFLHFWSPWAPCKLCPLQDLEQNRDRSGFGGMSKYLQISEVVYGALAGARMTRRLLRDLVI
jgi:hypothetical protein